MPRVKEILYGSMFSTFPVLSRITCSDSMACIASMNQLKLLYQEMGPCFCIHFKIIFEALNYLVILPIFVEPLIRLTLFCHEAVFSE